MTTQALEASITPSTDGGQGPMVRVLGPFWASWGAPTASKPRTVLALLVMRANKTVLVSELVDELWGEEPPEAALESLQTYIYHLRRLLAKAKVSEEEEVRIELVPRGYRLVLKDSRLVDGHWLIWAVTEIEWLLKCNLLIEAHRIMLEAQKLIRGDPLMEVRQGSLLSGWRQYLRRCCDHLNLLGILMELSYAEANYAVLRELERMWNDHRDYEDVTALLMLALYRAGRPGEALRIYGETVEYLREEIGLEAPVGCAKVNLLHRQIMARDPHLDVLSDPCDELKRLRTEIV